MTGVFSQGFRLGRYDKPTPLAHIRATAMDDTHDCRFRSPLPTAIVRAWPMARRQA
jgi:hypothetical protein